MYNTALIHQPLIRQATMFRAVGKNQTGITYQENKLWPKNNTCAIVQTNNWFDHTV